VVERILDRLSKYRASLVRYEEKGANDPELIKPLCILL
jgi:hypothetical protein